MNQRLGQPVKNKHKVPAKQWNKWSNHARRIFNDMYYSLRPSMQFAFLHPDALPASKEHWGTTRWNVAWMAADAAQGFSLASADKATFRTEKRAAKKKQTVAQLRKVANQQAARRGK